MKGKAEQEIKVEAIVVTTNGTVDGEPHVCSTTMRVSGIYPVGAPDFAALMAELAIEHRRTFFRSLPARGRQ